MRPILRLLRAGNLAVSFVGVLVGGLVALGAGVRISLLDLALFGLAGASAALVTAGGNVLNDVLDVEGDRRNHPDRPLVTGAVSVAAARRLAAGLFVAGIAAAVPVAVRDPLVAVLLAVAVGALLGYEFVWKARGFVGNLVVGLLTGLVFLYGGAAAGAALLLVPFGLMAFFATVSREVIKDMEDVEGDVDRRTLPRVHGLHRSATVARGSVAVAIVLSAVPFLWFVPLASVAGIMYLGLVAVADALFLVSVAYLPLRLHWEQSMSKIAMSVALLAFLAVAFR